MRIFAKKNLTLSPSKAHVGYSEVEALGHRVGRLGLSTVKAKVEAMRNMKVPETIKDLCAALGCFNYYRNFIPNYAQLAAPLHQAKSRASDGYCIYYKDADRAIESSKPTMHWRDFSRTKFKWTRK